MKRQVKTCKFFCTSAVFTVFTAVLFAFLNVLAAPLNGEEFEFTQPDGSAVTVLLFGDEFHIEAESPDGYTLIRDEDDWICYAKLSDNGNEYVSTKIRYTGKGIAPPNVQKKLRVNDGSIKEKRQKKKEALGNGENEQRIKPKKSKNEAQSAPPEGNFQPAPVVNDTTYGLILIIQYPDASKKTSLTKTQVEQFINDANNANSMFSWYKDVSNGNVLYKNIFSAVVTVDKSYSYYDDDSDYKRVPELITNALAKLQEELNGNPSLSDEFDKMTTYIRSGNRKTALALNIVHAHNPKTWAKGTWSHRGWYTANQTVNGIYFYDYQLSNLSGTNYNTIPVSTMLHENGHMLMGWPDLYNYDSSIKDFVGRYDIMSSGSAMPNPYLRHKAGWIDTVDITDMNATLSHTANSHFAYIYRRNANEAYYIEARRKAERSSDIPGSGLLIWHTQAQGDNTKLSSKNPYPQVALVQANNANWQQITAGGATTANSPFAASRPNFNKNTSPAAKYWDNAMSDINISEVSAAPTQSNPVMTFKIGTGGAESSSSEVSSSSSAVSSSSSVIASSSSAIPSSSSAIPSSSSVIPSSSSAIPSSSSAISSSSSSEDISPIILSQDVNANSAIAFNNIVYLQTQNSANMEFYGLNGKLQRSLNFKSGIYNVPVGDLPKGIYIVNVKFEQDKQMLRMVIK